MISSPVDAGAVVLRLWEPAEADLYLRLRDELVFRFTTEVPDLDADRCRANIEAATEDPDEAPFAICDRDGTVLGNMSISRRGKAAFISYWLAAEGRGKGMAAAALRAATSWAFEQWQIDETELEIDPANAASLRVAEAAGYSRRGIRLASSCGGPAVILRRFRPPVEETSG